MTPVLLHTGLPHKLLIAIGDAYAAGLPPRNWVDCAVLAGVSASPQAINRALSQLADGGLIEGVVTEDGWMSLRPTQQGLARIGRRPQPYLSDEEQSLGATAMPHRSSSERISAAVDEVSEELRTISRYASVTWLRTREAMAPRLTAVRTTVAETWHMFTTFP
jgi:hypothetical protein